MPTSRRKLFKTKKTVFTVLFLIYSISFNVPLKSRGEVEKLLQKFPAFTYDVEEDKEDDVALFNVYDVYHNKNSQKSEEEQSVENFTNLLEKLKNL